MENSPVIEIRTLESVRNVKDLQNNLVALKAKLADVNTSTDEYADITKELSQNQAALRNVMNGTHSTFEQSIKDAQGLDTSYNSLVQQLKEATQEWRAIPKYLSDADKAQGTVNAAWTEAANKVEVLRSALKDMDAATGNYTRNVGNYKSALDGFTGTMGQVKQVGRDLSSGLQACASTLSLMGYNTDGLTDSMKNLRIVVAAVQGLKGIGGLLKTLGSYFKAGKQAAAVTKEMAVAQQANTVATNTATVAMGGFQKALVATGIGALVVALGMLIAHFEEVMEWIGRAGEKLGLWTRKVNESKAANDKLNQKVEEQNRRFNLNAKLQSAMGRSQKDILKDKLTLINGYIKEKEAVIKAAEARVKEIEGHTWLQRVLHGENRERKKLLEDLETYKEELKDFKNEAEETSIDLRIEYINEANEAAEKAAAKAAEALKKAQEILNAGSEKALETIKGQKTELELINEENKENVKTIKDAIAVTEKLTGVTEEQRKILADGLVAEGQRYAKALSDYYKKTYEAKVEEESKSILANKKAEYYEQERIERSIKNILGMEGNELGLIPRVTAERKKEYDILKAQLELIKKDIEPDVFSLMDEIRKMTPSEIVKAYGEPLATALQAYIETEDKFQLAGEEISKAIIEGYEKDIQKALESGEFFKAEVLKSQLAEEVYEIFGSEKLAGLGGQAALYIKSVMDDIDKARLEHPLPQNGIIHDIFFGKDKNKEILLEEIRDALAQAEEGSKEFYLLQEQAAKLSMEIWDEYFLKLSKHFDTYGKATANVMNSVADAWEAALQWQVKNGKKSEEQAEKSFNTVKALQMASAVINTAAAAVQAMADPTVPNFYVKMANAAAAIAAGTAQVLKIAATDFSSNAAASTESTPQLVDRTPQLMYTVGLNPQEYAEAQSQRPIKAFVVDRDLSEGLDEYNRRRAETEF